MQAVRDGFKSYDLVGRDGEVTTLDLEFLGSGSSHRPWKTRWFEVGLYRCRDGSYVVHTVGRTELLNERDLGRIAYSKSAFEVVELLTVDHRIAGRVETYVPRDSLRALAQAAALDEAIKEAYLELG